MNPQADTFYTERSNNDSQHVWASRQNKEFEPFWFDAPASFAVKSKPKQIPHPAFPYQVNTYVELRGEV